VDVVFGVAVHVSVDPGAPVFEIVTVVSAGLPPVVAVGEILEGLILMAAIGFQ
jgi:hypothetical protein